MQYNFETWTKPAVNSRAHIKQGCGEMKEISYIYNSIILINPKAEEKERLIEAKAFQYEHDFNRLLII